jgi:hypothetical protein
VLREPIQVAFNLLPLHMVLKQAGMLEFGHISGLVTPSNCVTDCVTVLLTVLLNVLLTATLLFFCVYHQKNCWVLNPSGNPSIFLGIIFLAVNIGRYNRQWLEN